MKHLQQALASYGVIPKRDTSNATRQSMANRKVKTLLAKHPSIKVEKDRQSGFWITCSVWEDGGPLRGEQFAVSWEETLECVEVYVNAIEAKEAFEADRIPVRHD
jgi:hypothetical protein